MWRISTKWTTAPHLVGMTRNCVNARFFSSHNSIDNVIPKPFDAIPGPKPLPFIGNSREMKNNLGRFSLYLHDGFEKYGDIYRLKGMGMLNLLIIKLSLVMFNKYFSLSRTFLIY